jgi:Tfp pilus assembly protein PilO
MSFSTSSVVTVVKKNPIGVVCGLLTLALAATVYFRSDRGEELQTELDQKSAEASRLALNLKNSAQLKDQLDAIVAAQKQIESRLMRADELPTNRQYFYKLEADTGVKLLDGSLRQSPGSKKDSKAYLPTTFSVSVQGDYRQILTFLRRLETGSRYCRILTASCNSTAERGPTLVLSLTLELLGAP